MIKFVHPKYTAVKAIAKLLIKPFFPEPQKDPYWIISKAGNIGKYHGCGKDLAEYIVKRWEVDFSLQIDKEVKHWCSKADVYYYHVT